MRPRFAIFALVFVLVILAVVFVRRPMQRPAIEEQDSTPTAQATDEVPATPPTAVSAANQAMLGPAATPVSPPAMRTEADEERKRVEEART